MNKAVTHVVGIFLVSILLFGCSSNKPTNPSTMDEMVKFLEESDIHNQNVAARNKQAPPSSVTDSLVPGLDIAFNPVENKKKEQRFDIAVQSVPAKEFFMGLVAGTKYSMVVNPAIQGEISLNLKNVTIKEALNAARDAYGYEYESTNYGFKVMPPGLITKAFNVDYLNVRRTGKSTTNVSAGQLTASEDSNSSSTEGSSGSSSSRNATLSASVGTEFVTDFWPELTHTVRAIVGDKDGRSVVVSPQTGIIVVKALPHELREVEIYLDKAEKSLNRQVILEAKILEVQLNDGFQSGINWSYLTNKFKVSSLGSTAAGFSDIDNLGDFSGSFTLDLKQGNFNNFVKLLSTQGNVQVLSSPRISTVNNQKAIIKVGSDEFFVTDVSGSTSQGTSAASTSQSQSIELTPFFSGISLDVTPHIDRNGDVILHIHPTISEVRDKQKEVEFQGNKSILPSALSSIRETDNIVKAKNGQVVVIGGLMKTQTAEGVAKTPGLGDVPGVGALFRRNRQMAIKSELVIMLRPIIVNDESWSREVRKTRQRLKKVNRGFHFGDKGDIFKTS